MTLRRTALPQFLLVVSLLALAPSGFGQTEAATLSGLITDPQGKVMPAVDVEVTNVDTNVSVHQATNGSGLYVVVGLRPGQYRVSVTKTGFRRIDLTGLVLNVQDVLSRNFQLQLGPVLASITVVADEANINTTDATVSTVVDRNFAENLPMNGRSFQTLIDLTPGVVVVPSNSSDSGQFSVNGQRATSNYWMLDGVSANIGVSSTNNPGNGLGGTLGSFSAFGGTNSLVSVDAMQEFRVQTSTYAPEYGRTPGGQIGIVTRSGTNQFHGTAFDYLRNDIFDANNWFNGYINNPPLPKAKERQNDFGGTLGGPILRDRTFFFFSYEGLRLRLPQTASTSVPDANPADPLSRQNAKPAMQPFLNAFPLPNGPQSKDSLGNPIPGAFDFNTSYSNPASLDAYSLRVDHKLSDKLMLFGRYDYSPSELVARGGSTGLSALSVVEPSRITIQTATLGATGIISPRVASDFRFNYSRTNAESYLYLDEFGGAVPLISLPLANGFTSQNAAFALVIASLNVGRQLSVGHNALQLQRQINLVDNLSVQKGSHSLKFGVDFRRLSPLSGAPAYTQFVEFADVPSAGAGTPLGGTIQSHASITLLFRNLGVFAQDTWRIVPRLTLTYGLRWDVDFAPSSLNGPSIPAVTGYNLNDFSALAVAPTGTPVFKTTYNNVAPRVGLAYQVTQSQEWGTVVRSGFGVFYDLVSAETGASIAGTVPPFAAFKGLAPQPFPFDPTQIGPPPIPPNGSISALYVFNPNLKLPYTLEWNVALQQALGKNQTLTASYVGATGRRLLQTTAVGQPPTNPSVTGAFIDNTSTSDYHALQLQFDRRLSRDLQVLASYTWAHSIDTASASSLIGNIANAGGSPATNRGPSDFDIRHAFSAGVTYNLPAPKWNAAANAILRGWSLENIFQARSAPPVDVSDSNFFTFNSGIQPAIRPDVILGQQLYLLGAQYPGGRGFNPNAFTDPPTTPAGCNPAVDFPCNPARQGNVPRNFLRGFGATQWDFAVHRDIKIRESMKLQFRAETFNLLNHPNFGQPSGCFGLFCSAPFGVSTQMLGQNLSGSNLGGGAFSPLYQIGSPRSMQFALKFVF